MVYNPYATKAAGQWELVMSYDTITKEALEPLDFKQK